MPETYQPLPPHAVPAEAAAYVAAMTPKERELHDLAVQLLGSSYFVEWSHGFKKWRQGQAAKTPNPTQ